MANPVPNKNDGNANRTPVKWTVYLVDGAIEIDDEVVLLTKATVGAYTLAAPTNPDMNGLEMTIVTTTAAAHVVTGVYLPTGTTLTFTAAIGNQATARAYNGTWHVGNLTGVTIG
ncbi:hypothetical protein LCGC14_1923550 [marine sediment metagenome]|uniref:Uncharacterized protein n=1 Tax=marine sediment metagenome TaxID=412755 RepID=A0A0F9FPU5_9ZZZZ